MLAFALAAAPLTLGCAPTEDGATDQTEGMALSESESDAANVVRTYYQAAHQEDEAERRATLGAIVDDHAVLSAPSIKMVKFVDHLEGKKDFVDSVASASFILKNAKPREIIPHGNLVVARIDLPLPDGGNDITQIEYFEIKNGKIARLDSYYDSLRFAIALPSIGITAIKNYIQMLLRR